MAPPGTNNPKHPQSNALVSTLAQRNLHPKPTWLSSFLSTQSPTTPLAALTSTAAFRLLASDITATLSSASNTGNPTGNPTGSQPQIKLPTDIPSVSIPARTLPGNVVVQILDIMDIGSSIWSQVEESEMIARGEARAGRGQVVRVIDEDENDHEVGSTGRGVVNGAAGRRSQAGQAASRGPFKVLLQDAAGGLVWAFDGEGILFPQAAGNANGLFGSVTTIGTKVLLKKGCCVARGVAMLERNDVLLLGGRIEGMEKIWRENRSERLKASLPDASR